MIKKILGIICISLFSLALAAQDTKINEEYLATIGDKKSYKLIVKEREADYCANFLTTFPKSKYKPKVLSLYDELYYIEAYDIATKTFDVSGLKNYLVKFPEGKYRDKAGEAIDIISWQKARSENTCIAYETYLENFPQGKAVPLAKDALEKLKR